MTNNIYATVLLLSTLACSAVASVNPAQDLQSYKVNYTHDITLDGYYVGLANDGRSWSVVSVSETVPSPKYKVEYIFISMDRKYLQPYFGNWQYTNNKMGIGFDCTGSNSRTFNKDFNPCGSALTSGGSAAQVDQVLGTIFSLGLNRLEVAHVDADKVKKVANNANIFMEIKQYQSGYSGSKSVESTFRGPEKPGYFLELSESDLLENKGNIEGLYVSWIKPFMKKGENYIPHINREELRASEDAIKTGFIRFCSTSGGDLSIGNEEFGKKFRCTAKSGEFIGEIRTVRYKGESLKISYNTPKTVVSDQLTASLEKEGERLRKERDNELIKYDLMLNRTAMRQKGAMVCNDNPSTGVRFVGYVEDFTDSKIKILVSRAFLIAAPNLTPGGFQQNLLWDYYENWRIC